MGQRGQAVDALLGHQDDAAAVAAVAAVGPAAGNIFLPAEADAAVAPFARLHANFHFVDEHKYMNPWGGGVFPSILSVLINHQASKSGWTRLSHFTSSARRVWASSCISSASRIDTLPARS